MAVDVCDLCYGDLCRSCALPLKGRKDRVCKDCALTVSGVRGSGKPEVRGDRRTVKARRKAYADAEQPEDFFQYFDTNLPADALAAHPPPPASKTDREKAVSEKKAISSEDATPDAEGSGIRRLFGRRKTDEADLVEGEYITLEEILNDDDPSGGDEEGSDNVGKEVDAVSQLADIRRRDRAAAESGRSNNGHPGDGLPDQPPAPAAPDVSPADSSEPAGATVAIPSSLLHGFRDDNGDGPDDSKPTTTSSVNGSEPPDPTARPERPDSLADRAHHGEERRRPLDPVAELSSEADRGASDEERDPTTSGGLGRVREASPRLRDLVGEPSDGPRSDGSAENPFLKRSRVVSEPDAIPDFSTDPFSERERSEPGSGTDTESESELSGLPRRVAGDVSPPTRVPAPISPSGSPAPDTATPVAPVPPITPVEASPPVEADLVQAALDPEAPADRPDPIPAALEPKASTGPDPDVELQPSVPSPPEPDPLPVRTSPEALAAVPEPEPDPLPVRTSPDALAAVPEPEPEVELPAAAPPPPERPAVAAYRPTERHPLAAFADATPSQLQPPPIDDVFPNEPPPVDDLYSVGRQRAYADVPPIDDLLPPETPVEPTDGPITPAAADDPATETPIEPNEFAVSSIETADEATPSDTVDELVGSSTDPSEAWDTTTSWEPWEPTEPQSLGTQAEEPSETWERWEPTEPEAEPIAPPASFEPREPEAEPIAPPASFEPTEPETFDTSDSWETWVPLGPEELGTVEPEDVDHTADPVHDSPAPGSTVLKTVDQESATWTVLDDVPDLDGSTPKQRADTDARGSWIPPALRGIAPDAHEAAQDLPRRRR